jgi:hypothetical protein
MRNPGRFARAAFIVLTALLAAACSKFPEDFDGVVRPLDAAGLRAWEAEGRALAILYEGGYRGHEMAGYPSGPGWVADGLPVYRAPADDPDAG